MRRVRAAIEHDLLQPANLLRAVVHFDGLPCDQLEPLSGLPPTAITTHARCFLRFRDPAAAAHFSGLLLQQQQLVESEGGQLKGSCYGALLEGERERVYCEAIVAAKAGVRERRRRAQAAKRQRHQTEKQAKPKEKSLPEVAAVPAATAATVETNHPKPKRIVFDE